ncbi:MAG: hypothetical protein ACJAVO_002360 [Parvibaculaceae bacterium]
MSKQIPTILDTLDPELRHMLQVGADTLADFWLEVGEFFEDTFPAFLKLIRQIWEAWLTLFPRTDVWDPWGAACVMIFVVLFLTRQILKLLTPA